VVRVGTDTEQQRRLPPVQLLESVITTAMVGHDQTHLDQSWVAARTIRVDTKPVGVVEFDLSAERAQVLYDDGREAARQFLAGWKWEDHVARYRPEPAPAVT
jgi:NTE family protein